MKGIQYSAKDELYAAKKIFYEGNDKTRITFISIISALVSKIFNITYKFLSSKGAFNHFIYSEHDWDQRLMVISFVIIVNK